MVEPLRTELRFDGSVDEEEDVDDDVDDNELDDAVVVIAIRISIEKTNGFKCKLQFTCIMLSRAVVYELVFDKAVDAADGCTVAIGVMLTDDGSVDPMSVDFSSRGRFCFFFSGSLRPVLSMRFPFESNGSDLFNFTLSQSVFVFEIFAFFASSVIELRKFSLS